MKKKHGISFQLKKSLCKTDLILAHIGKIFNWNVQLILMKV